MHRSPKLSTNKTKLLIAMTVVVVLAGAGVVIASSMDHSSHNANGDSGPGNAADAEFVSGMIPHHERAVEMAQVAKDRAEHPEIDKLADEIIAAQEAEIGTMTPIKATLDQEHGEHMSGGGHATMEMDVDKLRMAEPFDKAFIDMMIPHHQDAVEMAEGELEKGENETLRKLAEDIIAAQNREIEQMRKWREEWYGSPGTSADPSGHTAEGHGALYRPLSDPTSCRITQDARGTLARSVAVSRWLLLAT